MAFKSNFFTFSVITYHDKLLSNFVHVNLLCASYLVLRTKHFESYWSFIYLILWSFPLALFPYHTATSVCPSFLLKMLTVSLFHPPSHLYRTKLLQVYLSRSLQTCLFSLFLPRPSLSLGFNLPVCLPYQHSHSFLYYPPSNVLGIASEFFTSLIVSWFISLFFYHVSFYP